MGSVYTHLNAETQRMMSKSINEKIAWVEQNHFVYHHKAKECLGYLEMLLQRLKLRKKHNINSTNFKDDIVGMTITGESGTGKSTTLRKFMDKYPPVNVGDHENIPVARCLLESKANGMKGLYRALLKSINHPLCESVLMDKKILRKANYYQF
ncbi:MAG: TniB family NTP-binding protein [Candidatus Hodarchaeales archaeon]